MDILYTIYYILGLQMRITTPFFLGICMFFSYIQTNVRIVLFQIELYYMIVIVGVLIYLLSIVVFMELSPGNCKALKVEFQGIAFVHLVYYTLYFHEIFFIRVQQLCGHM